MNKVLIVANSARLLVRVAKFAGFTPVAIDCFADVDTQEMALDFVKVDKLAVVHVKNAVSELKKQYCLTYVIYGSGLENHQDTLKYLEKNFTVLGNSFVVFASIQNKVNFFYKLKQYNISYPETSFQTPGDKNNWLIKPLYGEGGIGIKKYTSRSNNCYWQRYCTGTPRSVLFIANGSEYKIIGFHKQFVTQINDQQFVFAGVINQPEIKDSIVQTLQEILDKLVIEFSLKGINSLDFIENNNQCYVLEINARPSASLNLYDSGFLLEHINSCMAGSESLASPELSKAKVSLPHTLEIYRAYKIIFAEVNITINKQIDWPSWVFDIPQEGAIINTGMPICSIIAGGKNEQQVESLLLLRQQQLTKLLNRYP